MASYKDQYTQAVDNSLYSILSVISTYYENEHGVAVSAEDLMDMLGAKAVKASPASRATTVATKAGSGAKTATKAGATSSKTTAAKAAKEHRLKEMGQLPGLCLYVLTRGAFPGHYCTVRAVKGKNVCSSCDRKKGELGFYADVGEEEVDKGRAPGKFTGSVPDDNDEPPALTVVQYGDSNLIYVSDEGSPTLLMVLNSPEEEGGEETYTVIGQLDSKGKVIPLNKMGLKRANFMKLDVDNDMLEKLAEQGLIDYTPSDTAEEEVDNVPGMNVDSGSSNKKPAPPRKGPIVAAKQPPARRPAPQRAPRATVEVNEDEDEE